MEKEFIPQPMLSKEDVLAEYAKNGLDPHFAEVFYRKYVNEYDTWEDYENASDKALRCVKNGFKWFVLFQEIGHSDLWCEKAYCFGCEWIEIEISLDNEIICMREITESLSYDSPEVFQATKETEFEKHFHHIRKAYGKDDVFMHYYTKYHSEFGFDKDMLEIVSLWTNRYNHAVSKGKSKDFAAFYSTCGDTGAWRIAELREKLQKEGWDTDYVELYIIKYAAGLSEDGEEREYPDIPAYWEEKVIAFMKAWDYTRKDDSGITPGERQRFIDIYIEVYLHASHPENPKAIPWNRFDEFVLDIAKRRFNGEKVEVEPLTWESLMNAMEIYK